MQDIRWPSPEAAPGPVDYLSAPRPPIVGVPAQRTGNAAILFCTAVLLAGIVSVLAAAGLIHLGATTPAPTTPAASKPQSVSQPEQVSAGADAQGRNSTSSAAWGRAVSQVLSRSGQLTEPGISVGCALPTDGGTFFGCTISGGATPAMIPLSVNVISPTEFMVMLGGGEQPPISNLAVGVTMPGGTAVPTLSTDDSPAVMDASKDPSLTECEGFHSIAIYVNAVTSCPFALNVVQTYLTLQRNTFSAVSPVTGLAYTMTCTDSPIVCRGGKGAAVYLQ